MNQLATKVRRDENIKCSCKTNFAAKGLMRWPIIAQIVLHESKHINDNGTIFHGVNYVHLSKDVRTAWLSKEKRDWVLHGLLCKVLWTK